MAKDRQQNIDTIFVDCFDTIIIRRVKNKEIFKQWALDLSKIINIPWNAIYKKYNSINFKLCFKKLVTTWTLQEQFDVVIQRLYECLVKKYKSLSSSEFIDNAKNIYIQKELDCFMVNTELVEFLKEEKKNGKKIYLVSDFYCKSDVFVHWFTELGINKIFDKIFSSSDFEKEKATTKLYKELIRLLNLNPKNVIMYGDNIWSDVWMAKKCKLNAKQVKCSSQRRKYEKAKSNN